MMWLYDYSRQITTGSKKYVLAYLPVTAGFFFSTNLHRSDADLHSLPDLTI